MQRKDIFIEGEYYHLYNRGNSKQKIFLDDRDRDRFVKLLYLHNSKKNINFRDDIVQKNINAWDFDRGEPIVSIGAWVLMPNHFHLLVTIPRPPTSDIGGTKKGERNVAEEKMNEISFFMKKLLTSYSKYFNTKYKRTGGLFETNFRSSHANTDRYTKYIFSYIHLNPIKLIDSKWKEEGIENLQKTKDFLNEYQWSSYSDYFDPGRISGKILSKKDFPGYFDNKKVFQKEIFEWLSYSPAPSPMSDIGTREGEVIKSERRRGGLAGWI
jgi:putative transposase